MLWEHSRSQKLELSSSQWHKDHQAWAWAPWRQILQPPLSFWMTVILAKISTATVWGSLSLNCPVNCSWIPDLWKLWEIINTWCLTDSAKLQDGSTSKFPVLSYINRLIKNPSQEVVQRISYNMANILSFSLRIQDSPLQMMFRVTIWQIFFYCMGSGSRWRNM